MSDAAQTETRDLSAYLTGFVLALVLTAIPFGLVYFELLSVGPAIAIIAIAAVIQVGVHLRFFLHIGLRRTPRDDLLALAFAVFLICIMVGGSLWIMIDLYYRMML